MFLTSTSVDFFNSAITFFDDIGRTIVGVVDWVISFFQQTVFFVTTFLDIIPFFPIYVSWLPGTCAAVLSSVLLIAVLYRILGWGD